MDKKQVATAAEIAEKKRIISHELAKNYTWEVDLLDGSLSSKFIELLGNEGLASKTICDYLYIVEDILKTAHKGKEDYGFDITISHDRKLLFLLRLMIFFESLLEPESLGFLEYLRLIDRTVIYTDDELNSIKDEILNELQEE